MFRHLGQYDIMDVVGGRDPFKESIYEPSFIDKAKSFYQENKILSILGISSAIWLLVFGGMTSRK